LPDANPLLRLWTCAEGSPNFAAFESEHFLPAVDAGIAESRAEIAAITSDPAPATFDNSVVALERSGETLARVRRIFWMLASAQVTDGIRAVESEVSARLSAFGTEVSQDAALFARIRTMWEQRSGLTPEQQRLVERSYKGFVAGGAGLADSAKQRLAAIDARLSALSVTFSQNVLAATNACEIVVGADQVGGLPEDLLAAASRLASEKQQHGRFAFILDRGVFEGLMTFADDRGLREQAWRAFTGRCQGGPHDNLAVIAEMVQLRQERAGLLGYASYADYALEDSMARTPDAAAALMARVWAPGLKQARREQAQLEAVAKLGDEALQPWDWRYFADRVRRESYAFDAAAVRTHLSLEKIRSAAFAAASRLYGLTFTRCDDVPVYHGDVLAWAVADQDGAPVGLLYTDYLARSEKHGGAWMGSLRVQEKLDGPIRPIVYTVANFASPANVAASEREAGTLLSLDEARTLFHEFGHALHALLSDVTYPSLAGTAVARDFVEFPSKLMEHWVVAPEALRGFGVPDPLVDAIGTADSFGQGFATIEFLASAIVDLDLHRNLPAPDDIAAFEADRLTALGTPPAIGMRHRLAYFTHVFSGGYASAYYSYLWAEVLDADVFEAFEEAGMFDPATAARFRREVLAPGDSRDPADSFFAFRGRQPDESALLRSRALA
jgi:peptidyl-dipeptidase Dcp